MVEEKKVIGIENTVLVTAYAPAPRGTTMYEVYNYAGVIMEIDINTNQIVNAEFTFITNLAKDFFVRLLQGYNLESGIDPLAEKIRKKYYAPSVESVIACIKVGFQRYFDLKHQYYPDKKTENRENAL